jgi:acid phosphatase (class A)
MRYGYLVFLLALAVIPAQAQMAEKPATALLERQAYEPSRFLPPPPDASATAGELAELHAIANTSDTARKAAAARDARDETPDIFNGVIGFDIATTPQTNKLLKMVADEEEVDSKAAKSFFHRPRPYTVDSTLTTCTPVKPGKAENSYPSGHATLAFSMGVVLAQLLPAKAQAILERAHDYAENRLVCGVHYRSDIVAGQQFGTVLALRLMELPAFQAQMQAARAELAARG